MANDLKGRRQIVARHLPKDAVGVEIGVFKGDFSSSILEVLTPKKLFLIDPWQNMDDPKFAKSLFGKDSVNDMAQIMSDVAARFKDEISAGRVVMMQGKSEERLAEIKDASVDFVYIDGDHSYEGVKQDLELAFPKVKPGGFLALDDYNIEGWWKDGINRAAHEFLGAHASALEIKGYNQGQLILRVKP
jgi:predicted O-methyltransferase YrrM